MCRDSPCSRQCTASKPLMDRDDAAYRAFLGVSPTSAAPRALSSTPSARLSRAPSMPSVSGSAHLPASRRLMSTASGR